MINNPQELFQHFGVKNFRELDKAFFRGTRSGLGVLILFEEDHLLVEEESRLDTKNLWEHVKGIIVTATVEESDWEMSLPLYFPFYLDCLDEILETLDNKACSIWSELNTQ